MLTSEGGPPEVEYALFDPGEIQLEALGPGMVREVGYETVAASAAERLEDAGISWQLALDCACAMQPTLAMAYARGGSVRRVATAMGPAELFDGLRYDATRKTYDGRCLDLPSLEADAGVQRLSQLLQGLHLLAMLRDVGPRTSIRLVTRDLMAVARPSGRSYRRSSFRRAPSLPDELRALAKKVRGSSSIADRSVGPSSTDLLEILRERIAGAPDNDTRDRLRAIEKAVGIRQRPMRGPLADSEVWALDEQLSAGKAEGVVSLLDTIEKSKGKQPASVYLRTRAAFVAGMEPPRTVADRISSMALTMPSFVELELLAFEAWNAAADPGRALPFARDIISSSVVTDELRYRESRQQPAVRPPATPPPAPASAGTAGPAEVEDPGARREPMRLSPSALRAAPQPKPRPPSAATAGPAAPPAPPAPVQTAGGDEDVIPESGEPLELEDLEETTERLRDPRPAQRRSFLTPPPIPAPAFVTKSQRAVTSPLHSGPPESHRLTPPMNFDAVNPSAPPAGPSPTGRAGPPGKARRISGTWIGPKPDPTSAAPPRPAGRTAGAGPAAPSPASARTLSPNPPSVGPLASPLGGLQPSRPPGARQAGSSPGSGLPGGPLGGLPSVLPLSGLASQRSAVGTPSAKPPAAPRVTSNLDGTEETQPGMTQRITSRPPSLGERVSSARGRELMRGASQPPYRSDSPEAHAHIPRLPPVPHLLDEADDAAELPMPQGLQGDPKAVSTLPRTVLDARVQFTHLSRELGRRYKVELGVDLHTDLSGIETMQRVLLERYADRAVTTPEAAEDVRRHGAFLSEILARTFGAYWVDIGPDDIGYWAMIVPPSTRVWPFGRVLRLIAMQHNERDLVAYFLELQGRASPGR